MLSDISFWDRAADNYQQVFDLGISEYNLSVLEFIGAKGHIFASSRILDIGCGVGKYGAYLSALGCRAALNDISPRMLDYARENLKAYPETEFFCSDFAEEGLDSCEGSFELVMSTMSPAINSCAALKRMTALSRGGCFAVRFCAWSQPLRDKALQLAGISPDEKKDFSSDTFAFEEELKAAGIEYEKTLQPYSWSDPRTAEEMADYLLRNLNPADDTALRERLISAARSLADENGVINDEVNTMTARYYWKGTAEK